MVVCITSSGNSKDSILDRQFGRCAYFMFRDTDSGMESFVLNEEMFANTGVGVFAFQLLEEKGAQALIARNIGQASLNLLKDAKIRVYQGTEATLTENLDAFMAGKLEKIT